LASTLVTILSFLVIFTVIVVSHEFGHFIIGRINGIDVEEFAIGMGPAIFKKKFKHTTLAIRLFPIGGACVFRGMDVLGDADDEEEEETLNEDGNEVDKKKLSVKERRAMLPDGSFAKASVGARIATVLAGPIFNIILAYLLSLFICWNCGSDLPIVSGISDGMPAQEAGLQEGDVIKEINGEKICVWGEVSLISMMSNGEPLNIVYERDGKTYKTTIVPQYSKEAGRYYIGLIGGNIQADGRNLNVFKYGAYEVRYWFVATYKSIGYMFSGRGSLDDLAGPVGVANVIDDTIEETQQYGWFTVFINMVNIAVLLSVNLGIINMLPFPAIDGGRLIFLLWEAITGKPVPPEKEGIVHLIGIILLFALMIVVLFNDIGKFFR